MTYDELLAKIEDMDEFAGINGATTSVYPALRSVVELHKPEAQEHGQYEKCWNCNLLYPCPTIQVIEKKLA